MANGQKAPPWALTLHKPTDQDQSWGDTPVVTETELPGIPLDRTSDNGKENKEMWYSFTPEFVDSIQNKERTKGESKRVMQSVYVTFE